MERQKCSIVCLRLWALKASADPRSAKILDMTATNGLLVYAQLMSYRCAIREARVGIDTAVPDKVLKMPPCDPRDPSVIPHDAQPYRNSRLRLNSFRRN
jgi:hypothetical protein